MPFAHAGRDDQLGQFCADCFCPAKTEYALDFSEFSNMQKLEAAGVFDSKILQPRDIHDPESFKVRRGKIGGYEDYLSTEDRHYAIEALRRLNPDFGYEPNGCAAIASNQD
jgi:hypothetical protein